MLLLLLLPLALAEDVSIPELQQSVPMKNDEPLALAEDVFIPELQQSVPMKDGYVDLPAIFGYDNRTFLGFIDTVECDGMGKVEEYFVPTKDGYILRVFKLAPAPGVPYKGVLVWWHGMFLGAISCIVLGEGCQCYEYVKKGYEVWVPNSRGNRYSRNHTTLNPDCDPLFWKYGLMEMALFDVPAVLDYIIKVTGVSQVVYVCHSQGCTILMILCACRPEYNALICVAFGLSPTFWLTHSGTPLLELEAALTPAILAANGIGVHGEIIKYRGLLSSLAIIFCAISSLPYPLCMIPVYALFNYNGNEISKYALQQMVGKEPSGSSFDLFGEWGYIKKEGFQMLNGTKFPLDKVTLKWCLCVSKNDNVADLKDVITLLEHIPNVKYDVCVLKDVLFGHLDHVIGVHSTLYDAGLVTTYLEKGTMEGCVGRVVTAPDTNLLGD